MKKKALSAVLLTAAFGLVSCTDPVVSSTTSTGGDETSSTTSELSPFLLTMGF